MVIPLIRMPDAGHAQHLIVFRPVSYRQIPIGDNRFRRQCLPHMFRINEPQEALPEFRRHKPLPILPEPCMVGEMFPHRRLFRITGIRPIAHGIIVVHIHMVHAAIVRGQGGNHAVQFLLTVFLCRQLFIQRQLFLQLLLLCPCLCLRRLDPGHLRHIHTHAQQAQPARGFPERDLGRLQIAEIRSGGIRHILEKDMCFPHGHGLAVILHEMIRRRRIKYLMIRQADHFLRSGFPGVFRECLVAGKVSAGGNFLGKAHGGHIGQQ